MAKLPAPKRECFAYSSKENGKWRPVAPRWFYHSVTALRRRRHAGLWSSDQRVGPPQETTLFSIVRDRWKLTLDLAGVSTRGSLGVPPIQPSVFFGKLNCRHHGERRNAMPTEPLVAAAPYLIEQKYQDYTPAQHAVFGLNWSAGSDRRWIPMPAGICSRDTKLSAYPRMIGCQICTQSAIGSVPRGGWSTETGERFSSRAFFQMLAARKFPPQPHGCAAPIPSNIFPSRIFFTMSSGMSPCTRIQSLRISC